MSLYRHIVFVQYGDYAEAVHRFDAGGEENYYAQKYTVDHVALLAANYGMVTVITLGRDYPLENLSNGVSAVGIHLYPNNASPRHAQLLRELSASRPTDLIVATPLRPVLRWAMKRNIRTLPLFADSFRGNDIASKLRAWLLMRILNASHYRWVANHNVAASEDLARIGVKRDRILPFDWPPLVSPSAYSVKEAPTSDTFRVLYVGMLLESKGISDALRAIPAMEGCSLTAIGSGPDEPRLHILAAALGVSDRVNFLGKLPHSQVLAQMRAHDVVLVPSRHEYAEGLPMTIYEALCTRTPVVASDHPMFIKRLLHEENALIFKASDSDDIARSINRLKSDGVLYKLLSRTAGETAEAYLCPLKWHDLIDNWLVGSEKTNQYLASYSLAAREYS